MPRYWSSNTREIPPRANPFNRAYPETVYGAHVFLNIVVIATDPDGDNLSYSANSSDDNVSTLIDGNQLTLSPALDWNGTVEITVTVEDDGNPSLSDTEQFELIVNPMNDAPIFITEFLPSAIEEGYYNALVIFTDVDNQPAFEKTAVEEVGPIAFRRPCMDVSGT